MLSTRERDLENNRLGKIIQRYLNGSEDYQQHHRQEYMDARTQLTEINIWLAKTYIKPYVSKWIDFQELRARGVMGVYRASANFNPDKAKFSTHAHWLVKNEIFDMFRKKPKSRILHIPMWIARERKYVNNIEERLTENLGRAPTQDELIDYLYEQDFETKKYSKKSLSFLVQGVTFLEKKVLSSDNLDKKNYIGIKQKNPVPLPIETLIEREEKQRLRQAIDRLSEYEQTVIKHRYGFDGPELSYSQIGKLVGLSRTTIKTHLPKILEKIRGIIEPSPVSNAA